MKEITKKYVMSILINISMFFYLLFVFGTKNMILIGVSLFVCLFIFMLHVVFIHPNEDKTMPKIGV